jgi:ribosome-binding protein aMBF1 (putative translation factor)
MAEKCIRCDANGEEVRLYDAIYDGRMSSICERCSIIENIPIIKKPNPVQLKESEQGVGVFPRMKRLAGMEEEKPEEIYFREDKLKELEGKPELEIPEQEKFNLIEHFHWEVMKNRRRKGLSQKQLAESLGESEIAMQMIEKGELPENAEILIRKLEQFFQVKLKKVNETEQFLKAQEEKEPVLLDEQGHELVEIPEEVVEIQVPERPEGGEEPIEIIEEDEEFGNKKGINLKTGEFDITKANLNEVKIQDLQELNRKKVEATRKEQIEEQGKIEERNRLIEARKEELRMIKEKETDELDDVLGGTELIGGNPEKEKEVDEKEFDEELI